MDFEYFLYIIILFFISLLISSSFAASQIAADAKGKNDPTSSFINALQTGNFASAFQNILAGVANKTIAVSLIPIKTTMDDMMGAITQINENIHSGNKMVNRTRGFAFDAINNFVNQIYSVIGSIQTMITRIMYLMKRVVAVFITILYTTRSSLAIGESFSNSLFGKILMFFCFSGDTILELKSGVKKYISQLNIGDELKYNGKITGITKCIGNHIPLYSIDGIKMSGEHMIYLNNVLIFAKEHPRALLTQPEPILYNIETENGKINLPNGNICLDYNDDGILRRYNDWVSSLFSSYNYIHNIHNILSNDIILMNYRYIDKENEIHTDYLVQNNKNNSLRWTSGKSVSLLNPNIDKIDRLCTNNLALSFL